MESNTKDDEIKIPHTFYRWVKINDVWELVEIRKEVYEIKLKENI
jgi:hypothetical protein